jgi:hypothetical protein
VICSNIKSSVGYLNIGISRQKFSMPFAIALIASLNISEREKIFAKTLSAELFAIKGTDMSAA